MMQQQTTDQRTINWVGEVLCRHFFQFLLMGGSPILKQHNNKYWMLSLLLQWDLMAHGMQKRMHSGLSRSWNTSEDRAIFFVASDLAAKRDYYTTINKSEYAQHVWDVMF
jgi:hypothetical protein